MSAYTSGDNGNVNRILNNVDSTRSTTFTYDTLNRLSQANTISTSGANCWGETYTIDAWGNLTNRGGASGMTGCSYEGLNTTATTQNQLGVLSYDAAGNVTNDGNGNQPTYDGENRIVTDAGVTYYYDADGLRRQKSSGTMYWPGSSGTLTETDLNGTINEEYIFFNGERIARVDRPSGAVHYYLADRLGSASVITDASGNVQEQYYYYPYGGLQSAIGSDPNHYKFTGKERDGESGLDNFEARFYTSSIGRFMTPDWAARPTAVPYGTFGDPQTLNLYTYVENAPLNRADADGHGCRDAVSNHVPTDPGSRAADCSLGGKIESAWLTATAPIQKAADWADEHPLIMFPLAIAAALKGNEGPLAADEAALAQETNALESSAATRASELANALGKTKDFVTTAVTETKEGVRLISSSENALRPAQRALLNGGEVAVKGAGHAEETGIRAAQQMGLTPTGVAASRGICQTCWDTMRAVGAEALSDFKRGVFSPWP